MNEIKCLKQTAYYCGSSFGNFPKFFQTLESGSYLRDSILSSTRTYKAELDRLVSLSLTNDMSQIISSYQEEKNFYDNFNRIATHAANMFNITNLPKLHIVDDLPGRFKDKPWDSMSVDKNDCLNFSIAEGIYYKRKFLTHGYFEFVMAHEVVHWIISEFSGKYYPYVTLLEEGLCDFIGALILLEGTILPITVLKNAFIYNRATKPIDNLWHSYWKYCLFFTHKATVDGVMSILDLVRKGRDEFNYTYTITNTTKNSDYINNLRGNAVINVILESTPIYSIPYISYDILFYIVNNSLENIKVADLVGIYNIQENIIRNSLDNLENAGLIHAVNNDLFYNPNKVIPAFLRYEL